MIYVVEDEPEIRDLIVYTLNSAGFQAKGFSGGKDFLSAVSRETPRLALLDVMLPGEDGLALLKRLRAGPGTKNLPVMMVSAKGSEYDKVVGLDSGADDYMAKPFGMMELIARVKTLLRRAAPLAAEAAPAPEEFRAGGLYLNIPKHTVTADKEEVFLTPKEFELLAYLLKNKDIVISRERLLEAVWSYEYLPDTRTVDVHILTLRGKLKRSGAMIQTVRGIGYKLGEGA